MFPTHTHVFFANQHMKRRAASEPAASAGADVTDIDQESSAATATASLLQNLREKQQAKRQKRQRRRWDFRTVAFFEQRSSSSEFDDEQDNSANVDDHCMQIGYGRAPAAAGNSQQNNNNNKGDSGGGGGGGSGNDHSEAEKNASNPEAGDDQADDDGSATAPQLYEEKQHYVHRLERFALQRHVTENAIKKNFESQKFNENNKKLSKTGHQFLSFLNSSLTRLTII
ncbi:hypothetical protein niasHT_024842 [Heterodera trifolii]|uniref:Uncharacterized protein n=1 Tax=Heterodera trifolii TaxID=157864 RepID=A0ABD2JW99_9BILA